MSFGYLAYWTATFAGAIPIEYANYNEFAYEWSFGIIDPLIAISYIASLVSYIRKHSKWNIMLTISLSISLIINLQTMIYWIILRNFSNPMWFMALFIFSYSLVGLIAVTRKGH